MMLKAATATQSIKKLKRINSIDAVNDRTLMVEETSNFCLLSYCESESWLRGCRVDTF